MLLHWFLISIAGLDQWNFVLHPVHSSITCDPQGDFVRKWVPELAGVPSEYIHQPWLCSQTDLAKYNVCLGKNYPERIVTDLENCRNGSIQDVTEARRNHGKGFIDTLNGRDKMVFKSIWCNLSAKQYIPGNSNQTAVWVYVNTGPEADDSTDHKKWIHIQNSESRCIWQPVWFCCSLFF